MDTQRVPSLDWPRNLFGDVAEPDIFEALANPFLEPVDFVASHEAPRHDDRVASRECELAA